MKRADTDTGARAAAGGALPCAAAATPVWRRARGRAGAGRPPPPQLAVLDLKRATAIGIRMSRMGCAGRPCCHLLIRPCNSKH